MKNKYEELLERATLKKDMSDCVRQSVFQYEKKPKKRCGTLKIVCGIVLVVLCIAIPNLIKHNTNELSFRVMADENLYNITKGKIILKELNLENYENRIYGYNKTTITIYDMLPLSLYVEGDNIDSITYRLSSGDFWKYVEVDSSEERILEGNLRKEGSSGFSSSKDTRSLASLIAMGFDIQDDPTKEDWEYYEAGKEITIPYEEQRTINGLYGINVTIFDEALVARAIRAHTAEEITLISEQTKQKVFQSLNELQLDVRVNYDDGTYETTKLKFVVNEDNYNINFNQSIN